jgi:hypothetical protein
MVRRKIFPQLCLVLCSAIAPYANASENRQSLMAFAKPTVDVAFRHLMGDETIATALINSILGEIIPHFDAIEAKEIHPAEDKVPLPKQKSAFMDFHIRRKNGAEIIIEMQVRRHAMFDERSLYYAAYTFSHQLTDRDFEQEDWYRSIKPLYAIQLLDYETNPIRGLEHNRVPDEKDKPFVQMVRDHPIQEKSFTKHYVMCDQNSKQTIDEGIHLIQIELPRVSRIRQLNPQKEGFYERAKNFSLSDWWYCIFVYANQWDPDQLENFATETNMPEIIKKALERLSKQTWGPDLTQKYKTEETLDVRQKYSTALAVERLEGEITVRIEDLIRGFVEKNQLSQKKFDRLNEKIKMYDDEWRENLVRKVWNEMVATNRIPEDKNFNEFNELLIQKFSPSPSAEK